MHVEHCAAQTCGDSPIKSSDQSRTHHAGPALYHHRHRPFPSCTSLLVVNSNFNQRNGLYCRKEPRPRWRPLARSLHFSPTWISGSAWSWLRPSTSFGRRSSRRRRSSPSSRTNGATNARTLSTSRRPKNSWLVNFCQFGIRYFLSYANFFFKAPKYTFLLKGAITLCLNFKAINFDVRA